MIVKTDRSFDKDIVNISNKVVCSKVADIIEKMQTAENTGNLTGVKKIVGYSNYYRIRVGDYRIGFRIEVDCIILERCLHRKHIYRHFPKK